MQHIKLASVLSGGVITASIFAVGSGSAIAQPNPTSPSQTQQPNTTPHSPSKLPEDQSQSSSSMTPAPIVPACPFPDIPLSKTANNAIFIGGELTIGEMSASGGTSFSPRDGSDADLESRATGLVIEKKLDEALLIAEKIKSVSIKTQLLLRIASAYVELGQLEKAYQLVIPLPPTPQGSFRSKEEVLGEIVSAYIKQGNLEQATNVANGISDAESRSYSLHQIARSYKDRKQFEQGVAVLSQAVAAYRTFLKSTVDGEGKGQFTFFLLTIFASDYLELKQKDKAIALLDEAFARAKAFPELPYFMGFNFLSAIPMLYLSAGREDKAKEALSFVLKTAQSYKEPITRSMALIQVSQGYVELKQPEQTTALLTQAEGIAKADKTAARESIIWVTLARVYGGLGQYDQAFRMIASVEPVALREQVKQTLICSQKQK